MEGAVGILKTTIAMEQRVGIRIRLYSTVKGLENQWVVIAITYDISNKATVIEIQDCTEIYFVYLNTLIPFELRNVGKPFLVGLVRIELAVKEVTYSGFFACRVKPWLLYLMVDLMPLARQIRRIRLSFTWMCSL